MEPSRPSPLRIIGYVSAFACAIYFARRDFVRRGQGLVRRGPAEVLADLIASRFRRAPGRWLARFVVKHQVVTYVMGIIALFLLFKYQQYVRRWLKRVARNYDISPGDALADYPTMDDVTAADGDAPGIPVSSTAEDAGLPLSTQSGYVASSSEVESDAATARQRRTPHRARFSSSDADTGSDSAEARGRRVERPAPEQHQQNPPEGAPYSQARGVKNVTHGYSSWRLREMERFMRLMRTTIQGLDPTAVLNVYEKMERLKIPAGGVIFRNGDDSADGMYIVVSGELATYAGDVALEDQSHALERGRIAKDNEKEKDQSQDRVRKEKPSPLSVFRQAQTVGENALIAGTVFARLLKENASTTRESGTANDVLPADGAKMEFVDALRPVSCVALTDTTVLRLDRNLFNWFSESFPHAIVNFILTTTTRQWRVAYYLLIDFLHLRDAWATAMEPPGHAPPFIIIDKGRSRSNSSSRYTQQRVPVFMATPLFGAEPGQSPLHLSPAGDMEPLKLPASEEGSSAEGSSASTMGTDGKPLRFAPPVTLNAVAVRSACSAVLLKEPGDVVYSEGMEADSLYLVLSGHGICFVSDVPNLSGQIHCADFGEDVVHVQHEGIPLNPAEFGCEFVPQGGVATRRLSPGCVGGGTACFVGIPHRETLVAVSSMEIAVFPRRLFTALADSEPSAVPYARATTLMEIALAVSRGLVPLLRMGLTLGLQRIWLRSGEVLFREGDNTSDGMYVVISGRLRTYVADTRSSKSRTIAERAGVMADGRLPSEVSSASDKKLELASEPASSEDESGESEDEDAPTTPSTSSPITNRPTSPLQFSPRTEDEWRRTAALPQGKEPPQVQTSSTYQAAAAARRRDGKARDDVVGSPSHQASSTHGFKVDIGRGETVGEISVLIREKKRAVSAVCIRDCELVRISQASFELISQRYPCVMTHFTKVLANRYNALTQRIGGLSQAGAWAQTSKDEEQGAKNRLLRYVAPPHLAPHSKSAAVENRGQLAEFVHGVSTSAISPSPTAATFITIAVVNAGAVPASTSDFAMRLVAALERTGEGPVLHLTSSKIDLLLGEGTAARLDELFVRAKIGAWLSAQEEKHRFVVFEADASPADQQLMSTVMRSSGWKPPSSTYMDAAKNVLRSVSGVGVASVKSVGKTLDNAVKAGIGVSPSYILSQALGQQSSAAEQALRHALTSDSPVAPILRSSAWTKVCVQQADLCLLVGQAHTSPELSLAEKDCVYRMTHEEPKGRPNAADNGDANVAGLLSRSFCAKELVLLHPDPQRRPCGTRNWLRLRRVSWHHHVRTWYEEDYDRIARHVCGKARGIVLGGGGSRGLAHLGALQVLEERKIGIDVIGGTSQGAFMAACYALTLDTKACIPLVKRLADTIGNTWSLLTSLTLPVFSYFSGTAFNDALIDNFKDVQIEDLWINYFCISTDVTNDTSVVHQTGPLWRYCRASMTVMGLLPPVWDRGRLLIDGGYTNNLPVEVLRGLAPQVNQTICVDVENKDNSLFEGIENYGDTLSGWYIAWKWMLSWVKLSKPLRIPPLSELGLKVSYISHSMMIRNLLQNADDSIIYIRPDVGTRFKLLDYHLMTTIVQEGIDATRDVLDKWEMRQQKKLLHLIRKAARDHWKALRAVPTVTGTFGSLAALSSRSVLANGAIQSPPPKKSRSTYHASLHTHDEREEVDDSESRQHQSTSMTTNPAVITPTILSTTAPGTPRSHIVQTSISLPSQSARVDSSATFTIGPVENLDL